MEQKESNIIELQLTLHQYVTTIQSLLKNDFVLSKFDALKKDLISCFSNGGKILICGNGGFAAISQHISAELMGKLQIKRNPLPAISLASDIAVMTCVSNDFGYEQIFSRQIQAIAESKDVVIVLTTSGKSKNILEAISVANEKDIVSYAITGKSHPETLSEICANTIILPFSQTELIQDVTMILFHKICRDIENEFATPKNNIWNEIISLAKSGTCEYLILDRDGVINELIPNDYITDIKDVHLNKQFLNACREIAALYKYVFIVSNQACIGKGIATEEQIERINEFIRNEITVNGGKITATYICPDADDDSQDRKPNTGLGSLIKKQYPDINFVKTVVVGDSYADSLFAQRIGSSFIRINNV